MNTPWSKSEQAVLLRHWQSMELAQLLAMLPGRSARGIRARAWRLGVPRRRNWRSQPPIDRPTLRDVAWAAGIYEGEGSISRNRNGGITAKLSQRDGWLPRRMLELFGGAAKEYGPYGPYAAGFTRQAQTIWQWNLCGPRAWGFLLTIYAYLSPRRRSQIKKALYG